MNANAWVTYDYRWVNSYEGYYPDISTNYWEFPADFEPSGHSIRPLASECNWMVPPKQAPALPLFDD